VVYAPTASVLKKLRLRQKICIKILNALAIGDLSSREIQNKSAHKQDDIIFVIQELLENDRIIVKTNNKYTVRNNGKIKNSIHGHAGICSILDSIIKIIMK
jgi:ribosomal protein S19E (S16A)